MTHVEYPDIGRIVAVFGGESRGAVLRMAKMLGIAPSTIYTWLRTGDIPAPRQRELLHEARQRGLPLTPEHFFPG